MVATPISMNPLLDLLFDEPGGARCLVAPDDTILRVNEAWWAWAGVPRESAIGANLLTLLPDPNHVLGPLFALARAGHQVELPRHERRMGEKSTWWLGGLDPVPMEKGIGLLLRVRELPSEGAVSPAAQALLHESEERLRLAIVAADLAIWSLDPATQRLTFTSGRQEVFGLLVSHTTDRTTFLSHVHPDDRQRVAAALDRALSPDGDGDYRQEYRCHGPDGVDHWVEAVGRCAFDLVAGKKVPVRFVGTALEITRRKAAEQTLRESEQRFRLALRSSPVAVSAQDRSLRYVWAYNQRTARPEELIGQRDEDLLRPDEAARLTALKRRVLEEQLELHEELWLDRPGGRHFLHLSIEPLRDATGAVVGVASATVDLTPMKRAQEAVREREERLAVTLRSIGDAVIATDAGGRVTLCNGVAEALTGWSSADALGRPLEEVFEIVNEDSGQRAPNPAEQVLRKGLTVGLANHTSLVARDGTRRPIADSGAPIRDERGAITGVVLVFRDQTEEREAERALQRSEGRYRALIEHSSDLVMVLDQSLRVTFWSPSSTAQLGWAAAHMEGRAALELVHAEDRARAEEAFAQVLSAEGATARFVARQAHQGGGYRLVEVIATNRLGDPAVQGIVANGRDLTQHRHLEEQLAQSQKMEGIGRLAGGVAHDFNNLLTAILSASSLALEHLRQDDPLREELEAIDAAGQRAAGLTRQLLAFSRKQVLQPRRFDVNTVLVDLEKMLQRIIGEDVELRLSPCGAPALVRADPGQFEQVIMNLTVNARDAMPTGGRLTITTGLERLEGEHPALQAGAAAGAHVVVTLSDTGVGMGEQTLARMFEPFFTTKGPGQGTGLGLSTVYGIVKQSGGAILARSALGAGTTFTLYLPCDTSVAPAGPEKPSTAPTRGSETILVVEDDQAVRALTRRVLAGAGYTVLTAADASEGLRLCEEHRATVQLVLTDVVMPRMSGREFAERLEALRPGLRVLFMSGYTDDAIVRHGVQEALTHFLGKPFTQRELLRKVRDVLDAAGG